MRGSLWENQRAIAAAKKETQSVCAEGRGGTEAQRNRIPAIEKLRSGETYFAAAWPGRLNKFGGPNLFTLDIDRRRRARAQKPRRRSRSSAAWVLMTGRKRLKKNDGTGNRCFGTTTHSFSPLRVTVTFGARGLKGRAMVKNLPFRCGPIKSIMSRYDPDS